MDPIHHQAVSRVQLVVYGTRIIVGRTHHEDVDIANRARVGDPICRQRGARCEIFSSNQHTVLKYREFIVQHTSSISIADPQAGGGAGAVADDAGG